MNGQTRLLTVVAAVLLWRGCLSAVGLGRPYSFEPSDIPVGEQIPWDLLPEGAWDPYGMVDPGDDPDEGLPAEIISGRAAYLEVLANGSKALPGQESQPISGTGGSGGSIEIHAGLDIGTGDGSDGILNTWIVLGPDETRQYKYVGFGDGSSTSEDHFVTITVRGQVTIYCQHNFMANIKADYSYGAPELTIHAGRPEPIRCYADGRFAGTSASLPHAVGCYFSAPDGQPGLAGGTFRFYTPYEGDLNVFLCADGGTAFHGGDGGTITVVNKAGDIRGEASAVEGIACGHLARPGTPGWLHLEAMVPSGNGSIVGRFWASQEMMGGAPGGSGQSVGLIADSVRQLPLETVIEYDYPAAADVVPGLLLDLVPRKPLSDGVYLGHVEVAGNDPDIEIKTGVSLDVGDGSDGAITSSAAILEPGTYELTCVCSRTDDEADPMLFVKGDTVIRCQHLFAAGIFAHASCRQAPKVTVYAGTPMPPVVSAMDPAWFRWSLAHCDNHRVNSNMGVTQETFLAMAAGDIVVGRPGSLRHVDPGEVDGIMDEIGGALSSGPWLRALTFNTTAYGRIDGGTVSTWKWDTTSLPGGGEAQSDARVVMMAGQGDLRIQSIGVSGACGGAIYCLADNIVIQGSLRADGGQQLDGSGGDGGRIYCEARNYYDPNVLATISVLPCAHPDVPISACGGSGTPAGNAGLVTIVPPDAVSPECISVLTGTGMPASHAVNEWQPDLTGLLEYEYEQ